jgi:hypothetical protein
LAAGGSLLCDTPIFYSNIWRAEDRLFKAYGRIFFTGNRTCMYRRGFLFSDLPFVFEDGNGLPASINDLLAIGFINSSSHLKSLFL